MRLHNLNSLYKWLLLLLLWSAIMTASACANTASTAVDADLDEQSPAEWVDSTTNTGDNYGNLNGNNIDKEPHDNNIPSDDDNGKDDYGKDDNSRDDYGRDDNGKDDYDKDDYNKDDMNGTDEVSADPPEATYPFGPPNEIGNLMVIMYHGLSENNPPYDRRTEDFLRDLQYFYEHGYRLVSVNDLMDKRITVAAGFTPLSLTFDDSKSTSFSLTAVDGILIPKPGCIVDILNKFYIEHPDFGKAATFYINGKDPFSGAGTLAQRFRYLIDNGYDLGNHTWSHADLSKLSAAGIQEEIGRVDQLIKENCPDYTPRSFAYPQGKRPKENLRSYALAGEYNGETYTHGWGIREGQSLISANPFHTVFDPTNVPRVRASDDSTAEFDVQDMGYFLRYYANHPDKRYISDGDPDVLTVPEDLVPLVNLDALGDIALQSYDPSSLNTGG